MNLFMLVEVDVMWVDLGLDSLRARLLCGIRLNYWNYEGIFLFIQVCIRTVS
jgi:hypothetical protein